MGWYTVVYMSATTIKLDTETKHELDMFREYKRETYDELIRKLIFIVRQVREHPELGQEEIIAIENARRRIRSGNFVTEDEAKKRLGF